MVVIFDQDSSSLFSKVFTVFPGTYLLISGFGFDKYQGEVPEGKPKQTQKAIVQKLGFAGGIFPDGMCPCGDKIPDLSLVDVPYKYVEDVTQCGLWHISACQNLVLLSVPGSYRLRLNDSSALGNVFVSAERYHKNDVGLLPHALFLGEV